MLERGVHGRVCARYIMFTKGDLAEYNEASLAQVLEARRAELPTPRPSAVAPRSVRDPGALSKAAYTRHIIGLDVLTEMESLYLSQRDRIGRAITNEADSGSIDPELKDEFKVAGDLLKHYAKMASDMGLSPGADRFKLTIEGRGLRRLGDRVAETLKNPESRRKVLSLLERTARVDGGSVIDAESEVVEPSGDR